MARNAIEGGAGSEIFYDAPAAKVSSEEKRFKLKEELEKSYEEQLKRITETVDLKLKESCDKLAQQIAELKLKESSDRLEQQITELKLVESSYKVAQQKLEQENIRLEAEIIALSTQVQSNDELHKRKLELLETAHRKENENQRLQHSQIAVESSKLKESYDKLARQITELKFKEIFNQQRAEQENARLKAEIMALSAQVKSSDDELNKLKLEVSSKTTAHQKQQPLQIVESSKLKESSDKCAQQVAQQEHTPLSFEQLLNSLSASRAATLRKLG